MSEKTNFIKPLPPLADGDKPTDNATQAEVETTSATAQPPAIVEIPAPYTPEPGSTASIPKPATAHTNQSVAITQQAETPTVTLFQAGVYGSFMLNLILAGFVAVLLFRRASAIKLPRYRSGTTAFASFAALVSVHGMVATYLYTNFLWKEGTTPLAFCIGLWIVGAPLVAVTLSNVLTRFDKPKKSGIFLNIGSYIGIFALAMVAGSGSFSMNISLMIGLGSLLLLVVPFANYLKNLNAASTRHKELRSAGLLINVLLYGPALIPILVLCQVAGVGTDLTLLLLNLILIVVIAVASRGILAVAKVQEKIAAKEAAKNEESEAPQERAEPKAATQNIKKPLQPQQPSIPKPVTTAKEPLPVAKPTPAISDDPIIQFLNDNPDAGMPDQQDDPQTQSTESGIPPKPSRPSRLPAASTKPESFIPKAPHKPGGVKPKPVEPPKSKKPEAANKPEGVVAPRKPKKRI